VLCSRAVPPRDLLPLDEMVARLERAAAASPADRTELTWIESRRAGSSSRPCTQRPERGERAEDERAERSLLVRVRERGRVGLHRTGAADEHGLHDAVRQALAQARTAEPSPVPAEFPSPREEPVPRLHDEQLAGLEPAAARELVQQLAGRFPAAGLVRLAWTEGQVAVVSGAGGKVGLRRAARATAAALAVQTGGGSGAGRAAAAARSLAGLAPDEVVERALQRAAGDGAAAEPPAGQAPLLLAPEAVAPLLGLLNRLALSSLSFRQETSFLVGRLGSALFSPAFTLRDDGTDPRGLPFPFDLLGRPRRQIELIAAGVPVTPAVDDALALELGVPPTPHAVSHDEALASHLALPPEEGQTAEALASQLGDGALWASALDGLECYEPAGLRVRAVLRGVRRLAGGAPGPAVPDLVWEDALPGLFARLLGTAGSPVVTPGDDLLFGGTSAPLAAFAPDGAMRAM
jgi:PmbA protein